jgi:hypothetical protein
VLSKDEVALAELKKKFDVERAGLEVALLNATDEETKARIRSQLQILDDSTKGAAATLANLNSQLAAAKATDDLRTAFDKAAAAAQLAADSLASMKFGSPAAAYVEGKLGFDPTYGAAAAQAEAQKQAEQSPTGSQVPGTNNQQVAPEVFSSQTTAIQGVIAGLGFDPTYGRGVNITVQSLDPSNAAIVVQNALQELNRYGSSTTFAGAI